MPSTFYTKSLPYSTFNKTRGTLRIIYHSDGTKTIKKMDDMPLVVGGTPTFLEEGRRQAEEGRMQFEVSTIIH